MRGSFLPRRLSAMLLMCAATPAFSAQPSTEPAPPVTPPEVALKDPIAGDAMFWWRYTNFIKQAFEPPASFYWPVAEVAGQPSPFFPPTQPAQTSVKPRALDDAEKWAEDHKSTALIIVHKGHVLREKYWGAVSPDNLTNIRAITRGITPIMLGFAVASGKVALNDPIGRHIQEWRNDPRGAITVAQLAENVSGLEATPVGGPIYGNKDLRLVYSGDVVAASLAYGLEVAPGTRFAMAQENSQILALIIERAMGRPFADLVSERLWKPMGGTAAAYQLDRPGGSARVMCCMRTTPRDLVRLGVLLLNDGKSNGRQIIPAGWTQRMAAPSKRNPNFGLGFWLGSPFSAVRGMDETKPGGVPQSEPFAAPDVRFFEGGGYRELFIVPSRDLVILRLGVDPGKWDNAFLVNTVIRGMKP